MLSGFLLFEVLMFHKNMRFHCDFKVTVCWWRCHDQLYFALNFECKNVFILSMMPCCNMLSGFKLGFVVLVFYEMSFCLIFNDDFVASPRSLSILNVENVFTLNMAACCSTLLVFKLF